MHGQKPIGGTELTVEDAGYKKKPVENEAQHAANSRYLQKKLKRKQKKRRKQLSSIVEGDDAESFADVHDKAIPLPKKKKSVPPPKEIIEEEAEEEVEEAEDNWNDEDGDDFDDVDDDDDDDEEEEEDERPIIKATIPSGKSQYVPAFEVPTPQDGDEKWNASPVDVFKWLIHPITPEDFFNKYWEKKPLLIKRKSRYHYKGLFSKEIQDSIVRQNYLKYGTNVDLARYEDGERTTENPAGRVTPNVMWAMFEDGCSIRMLNPQTYHKPAWRCVSALSEYFGCMVGSNTYTTPKGSQGFAPHFDDIEAFLMQVEGEKYWRIYDNPDSVDLPRTSSRNFDQSELGTPILEATLTPGDLLYLPRGIVHQGVSSDTSDSVHITMSTYQLFDWGQYFSKLVPRALQSAMLENVEFRKGLPINCLDYMGVSKTDMDSKEREKFTKTASRLFSQLVDHISFDAAADDLALDNLHNNMPPALTYSEQLMSGRLRPESTQKGKKKKSKKKGKGGEEDAEEVELLYESITPETFFKIISPRVVRLVAESETSVSLYHSLDNGMWYHKEEKQSIDFPIDFADALEQIVNDENFMQVCDLEGLEEPMQIDLVTSLYDAGLLLVTQDEPQGYNRT